MTTLRDIATHISRADKKPNAVQDLKKAQRLIKREIADRRRTRLANSDRKRALFLKDELL